jgi:endonuclease YncB( thermonuclease family)
LFTACNSAESRLDGVRGKVTGIKDGDTFEILIDRKPEVVRLAHIDCPERGQPFGKAAKQLASDLCFGKLVVVKEEGRRDRYGRMIATVSLKNGTVVNKELVRSGLAWHFIRYSDDKAYARLEREARAAKIGLWSEARPVPPWEWRKR